MNITCKNCGQELQTAGMGWPDGNGNSLCQDCWEKDCSKDWWSLAAYFWVEPDTSEPEGEKE